MQSPDNPLTVSHSAFTQEGKEHHLGWRGPGAPADCGTALSRGRVTVCPLLRQHLPDWPGSVAGLGCPSSVPTASGISGRGGQALSGSRKPHRCHQAASHPREEQAVTGLGADQTGRWTESP